MSEERKSRFGQFYLPGHLIEDPNMPGFFAALEFVPMRVEYLLHQRELWCIGWSPKFDEVDLGNGTPAYIIDYTPGERLSVRRAEPATHTKAPAGPKLIVPPGED